MDKANQAPTVDQLVAGRSVVDFEINTVGVVVLERKSANPDMLQAIAKTKKAIDQMVDCCEDEKAGSITKGNESSASIDPTLESE